MSQYKIHPIVMGTNLNPYQSYDTMIKIQDMADILLPLHEPAFASAAVIPD